MRYDLNQAIIRDLYLHHVGNKAQGDDLILTKHSIEVTPELESALLVYFTKPFKTDTFHQFVHPNDLHLNTVYTNVRKMLNTTGMDAHTKESISIAQHLYSQGIHPNIKSGDLYVAILDNVEIEGMMTSAIGIFKTETKKSFIHSVTLSDGVGMNVEAMEGASIDKLDKGAIIFDVDGEDGYNVICVDSSGKDSVYWMDDFLQLEEMKEEAFFTRDAIKMLASFSEENTDNSRDHIIGIKKLIQICERSSTFDIDEFAAEAFEIHEEDAAGFLSFKDTWETSRIGRKLEDNFSISEPTVASIKKKLQSTIKLDTNIDIKLKFDLLDNGRKNIENGYDDKKGMNYYKVYYNEEL